MKRKVFSKEFLDKVCDSIRFIDLSQIEAMIDILVKTRESGRLFIIGSGGGAGNASHAVCDFRKLCGIEAYNPYDNLSFLTAVTNDEGYENSILNYLKTSKFSSNDCLFVLSVGGGTDNVSQNIVNALVYAELLNAKIIGIVGPNGGKTKQMANACIVIQAKNHVTPITESLQAIIFHLIVSDKRLQIKPTVW